jgi:hypothetical protein
VGHNKIIITETAEMSSHRLTGMTLILAFMFVQMHKPVTAEDLANMSAMPNQDN